MLGMLYKGGVFNNSSFNVDSNGFFQQYQVIPILIARKLRALILTIACTHLWHGFCIDLPFISKCQLCNLRL